MKSLDIKLIRDLWRMKGQVFAISLVIVSGISTFVLLVSNMDSLKRTRDQFYRDYAFADVFASLKRAPDTLKDRIQEIPGVNRVETRVVADVKLDIESFREPVSAKLVSLPDTDAPLLNRLYIRKGRTVGPWTDNEVVISEAFAEAHGFSPGDDIAAIINGRWKRLEIVGIALSPEFILQIRPGAIGPDFKRYAILWMGRHSLGTAYDMKGAFNDVVLTLTPGANPDDVIIQLDQLLNIYGGIGSYSRTDQLSHRFLSEEFRGLERSAEIFPAIFIVVAAFLINVVITRTVGLQRGQIAILKAFGYSNSAIGNHYVKMILLIVLIGAAGGIGVGIWLGQGLGRIYMEFYRFPYLLYELRPVVAISAVFIAAAAAVGGALYSVRKAAMLPPAEAMNPEPPVRYSKTLIDRLGLGDLLSPAGRIILRNIARTPVKTILSITGIALSCTIMIAGTFFSDAVDFMVDIQFRQSQKEDMAVTFTEPVSRKAVYELKSLNGVEHAEVFRTVPVLLKYGHRKYRTAVRGTERDSRLQAILDTDLKPVELPPAGIMLTDYLAKHLDIRPGEALTVEVLEGKRLTRQVPVAGIVRQYLGVMGYMDLTALNRLMQEGDAVSGAYLTTDSLYQSDLYTTLLEMPKISGTYVRYDEIRNFYETQAEALLFFTLIATILAGTIGFGVVYNSARIALSERGHELASLRVLGYTRAEISYIFLGELGIITILAIPVGYLLGKGLCTYIAGALSSDLFRIPVVIEPSTYSLAAAVVVVSACLSGLIVRYRLDHLDLVSVLKAKE